jgi:integrase
VPFDHDPMGDVESQARALADLLGRWCGCQVPTVRHPQPCGQWGYGRDLVRRNVVDLTEIPQGRDGRRSKSLTAEQVDAVLTLTASDRLHHYIVVSLLTGARTEELRALRWKHVHLDGNSRCALPNRRIKSRAQLRGPDRLYAQALSV